MLKITPVREDPASLKVRLCGQFTKEYVPELERALAAEDAEVIALDLANVQFHGSPDVRSWPVTSEITELRLRPGTLHLRHTREVEWPDVPYETTTQESTLWVFVRIDGQWHATGAERIRPNQFDKPEPDRVSQWIKEWLYNPQMWGPMANYVPAPGELVGFMLTAGIQRVGDASIVKQAEQQHKDAEALRDLLEHFVGR